MLPALQTAVDICSDAVETVTGPLEVFPTRRDDCLDTRCTCVTALHVPRSTLAVLSAAVTGRASTVSTFFPTLHLLPDGVAGFSRPACSTSDSRTGRTATVYAVPAAVHRGAARLYSSADAVAWCLDRGTGWLARAMTPPDALSSRAVAISERSGPVSGS